MARVLNEEVIFEAIDKVKDLSDKIAKIEKDLTNIKNMLDNIDKSRKLAKKSLGGQ